MYAHHNHHSHLISPYTSRPASLASCLCGGRASRLSHSHCLTHATRYLEFHIVSDHIFLAATMLICLHAEVVCLMSDMAREEQQWQDASTSGRMATQQPADSVSLLSVVLTGLFVVALFLYLFTAADMHYTAKYYHFQLVRVGLRGGDAWEGRVGSWWGLDWSGGVWVRAAQGDDQTAVYTCTRTVMHVWVRCCCHTVRVGQVLQVP